MVVVRTEEGREVYVGKGRRRRKEEVVKGGGVSFYSPLPTRCYCCLVQRVREREKATSNAVRFVQFHSFVVDEVSLPPLLASR